MNRLSEVILKPFQESIYAKSLTMQFTLNGTKKTWNIWEMNDSVQIIVYNISRNVLVLVKQFRPAVYYHSIPAADRNNPVDVIKYPAELGVTIELCAGTVDKNLPLVEIAREEILEECGYDVPVNNLNKLISYRAFIGASGSIQTTYYCEVTDDIRVRAGGGIDQEYIEVIEMTIPETKNYISKSVIGSPGSFLMGIYWFLYNKKG